MNWDQVEGKWTEFSGKAKAKWGKLTDDDVAQVKGNREALEGKFRRNMASPKKKPNAKSTTGSTRFSATRGYKKGRLNAAFFSIAL